MKKKVKSKVKNKELENSITGKFMEAVKGLGHDAEKLKKEIVKAGKAVSQKIGSNLKSAEKSATKAVAEKNQPEKKAGKKKDKDITDTKANKVVSKVSKASAKTSNVSSRSVAKPTLPVINKATEANAQKEVVKEASAPAPEKRTRAPRRKKEEIEAQKNKENVSVKEASAPVKRTRAPRKPKPTAADEGQPTETTGSAVL